MALAVRQHIVVRAPLRAARLVTRTVRSARPLGFLASWEKLMGSHIDLMFRQD